VFCCLAAAALPTAVTGSWSHAYVLYVVKSASVSKSWLTDMVEQLAVKTASPMIAVKHRIFTSNLP
jgi:hypothetical protein